MKGQYLTIEYVMFFAIGVGMVVFVYFIFSGISSTLKDVSLDMQLENTGELIRGNVINIFETSEATESEIIYDLEIPPTLSGCIYQIEASDFLTLNCTENYKINAALSLYGIDVSSDKIYSTQGFVKIISKNGKVKLE